MATKIIFRGALSIEKLKELCFKHLEIKNDSDQWNPNLHPEVVTLIKQPDGNWKGYKLKNGVLIESREGMPEHALTRLMTHE